MYVLLLIYFYTQVERTWRYHARRETKGLTNIPPPYLCTGIWRLYHHTKVYLQPSTSSQRKRTKTNKYKWKITLVLKNPEFQQSVYLKSPHHLYPFYQCKSRFDLYWNLGTDNTDVVQWNKVYADNGKC